MCLLETLDPRGSASRQSRKRVFHATLNLTPIAL
jgi:hypothetical protein